MVGHNHPVDTEVMSIGITELIEWDRSIGVTCSSLRRWVQRSF